jgi:hypothetical protein
MMALKEGRNAGRRKECRSSARARRVPPFLQQTVKGCKRHGTREGRMLRSSTRAHPFDPRHDALHELLREIVQQLVLRATTRVCHVLR